MSGHVQRECLDARRPHQTLSAGSTTAATTTPKKTFCAVVDSATTLDLLSGQGIDSAAAATTDEAEEEDSTLACCERMCGRLVNTTPESRLKFVAYHAFGLPKPFLGC